MRKRKPWFKEGDWFTVPLRRDAHAIGLVARADKRGDSFLGYYFPSAASEGDGSEPIDLLTPRDAVLVAASGSYGFRSNTWKVFASVSPLDYTKWPIPKFIRIDPSGHKQYETYGDDDVLLPIPTDDNTMNPMIPTAAIKDTLLDAAAVEDALWYRLRNRILGG
jgi:hypothetical protein